MLRRQDSIYSVPAPGSGVTTVAEDPESAWGVAAAGSFAAGGATSTVLEHPPVIQSTSRKQIESCRIVNPVIVFRAATNESGERSGVSPQVLRFVPAR